MSQESGERGEGENVNKDDNGSNRQVSTTVRSGVSKQASE